jgi:hypothetical protein
VGPPARRPTFQRRPREAKQGLRVTEGQAETDLDAWLRRNREALVRRWIAVVVEGSTLDELAARPISKWIDELEARLEVGGRASGPDAPARIGGGEGDRRASARDVAAKAEARVERHVEAHRRLGRPMAVALLGVAEATPIAGAEAPGVAAWTAALRAACGRGGFEVTPAGHAATALILPRTGPFGARTAVDRLRVRAWRLLAEQGPLADAGLAVYPDDGSTAAEVLAAARDRLERAWESPLGPIAG